MERVTTLQKQKQTKNFTKLKITTNEQIDKIVDKIIKFIYKDLITNKVDLSEFSEYLKFDNFTLSDVSELSNSDSSVIRNTFCKDKSNFYQGYSISIEDCNNNSIDVYTNTTDIAKRAINSRWRINGNTLKCNYLSICDAKYLYGMLKLLDITYEYCISNENEILNSNFADISLYNNSYSDEDIKSLIDMEKIKGKSRLFLLSKKVKQLIIDVAVSKQLEDYNIELMEQYDRDIHNEVARAFETKKNIPSPILKVMNSNKFLNYFSYLELDADTDLGKFRLVEEEWGRTIKMFDLNKLDKKPELRFRKLGKHKALGLYYPGLRCLCVDITSPSSFMHEFGHHIDYTYSIRPMSLQYEFRNILREYTKAYDAQRGEDKYLYRKRKYFTTPTEIFARTFEIYLVNKNVETSFLKEKDDMKIINGYPEFDEKVINQINEYFDSFKLDFKKFEEEKIMEDTKRKVKVILEEIKYSSLEQICFL